MFYEGPDLVAVIEDQTEIYTPRSIYCFSQDHLDLDSSTSTPTKFYFHVLSESHSLKFGKRVCQFKDH